MTSFHIGDIAHLEVGDIQEFRQLQPVGRSLIEHDELGVFQHGMGGVAPQEVVHILRYAGGISAVLSDTLPECEQEVGAVLVLEEQNMFSPNQ